MFFVILINKRDCYAKLYPVWCCSFISPTNKTRSDTMFFSYNLDVMHNSLLDFHSTSIGRLKPIKKGLKSNE